MTKRLWSVAMIFIGAGIAWFILGDTLAVRTNASDASQQDRLKTQWGGAQTQYAPSAWATIGKDNVVIPIRKSDINVGINLEQRRDGLLWYNLYTVGFRGVYQIRNTTSSAAVRVIFPLPDSGGNYANLLFQVGGKRLDTASTLDQGSIRLDLAPGAQTEIEVSYSTRGTDMWEYQFRKDAVESVNDFTMIMTTNFTAIDFPPSTNFPTTEEPVGNGYRLIWKYDTLVTKNGIGMTAPTPLQPGPLAQRITFWAPVALLFYFFVMLLITTIRGIDLHPMNYFFIAAAFFAFHLLFAYLVDRIPLEWAFTICSIVSIFLTISYLRLVVGLRFAALESGMAQLIYLVLFSFALFNEGWAGLTITIGAITTLFVAMQLTGRIRWSERFAPTQA